jgi:hypothetical protein
MSNDTDSVVILPGATHGSSQVHHRDFPEIRADGETPHAAAGQLVNHLTRALDSALTKWRRETIEKAITEVRAFLAQHHHTTPSA